MPSPLGAQGDQKEQLDEENVRQKKSLTTIPLILCDEIFTWI
jgi:hypothetical protein